MATAHFFGGPTHKTRTDANKTTVTKQTPRGKKKENKEEKKENATPPSVSTSSSSSASSSGSSSSASSSSSSAVAPAAVAPLVPFDFSRDYAWRDELLPISSTVPPHSQFAVLEFDKPVECPAGSILIGSRLDADIHLNTCRIAFQGRLIQGIDWKDPAERARVRVFKVKEKFGHIDRVVDLRTVIGRDLFQKGTDLTPFIGMKVQLESGEHGVIEASFGQGGKFKAYFQEGLPITSGPPQPPPASVASGSSGSVHSAASESTPPLDAKKKSQPKLNLKGKIYMRFKKYMYAPDKKAMVQDEPTKATQTNQNE